MARIPSSYTILRPQPGLTVIFRRGLQPLLEQSGLIQFPAPPPSQVTGPGPAAGRAAVWRADVGDVGPLVIKRYRRGGLLGRFRGDSYRGISHPLVEIRVCERAHQIGLLVPLIQCLWVQRKGRFSHRLAAATREIPRAHNLYSALGDGLDAKDRTRLLAAVAVAIRKLHDSGIRHPDLNLGNVLVTGNTGAPQIHLIDFDRATLMDRPLNKSERYSTLARMYRSLAKLSLPEPPPLSSEEKELFLSRYWQDESGPHPALCRRCRRELALHRLWWRLNPPRTGG